MEIDKRRKDGIVELAVSGRLDAYWADHLSRAIDEALREGADHLRLEMSGVSYVSSVGIRVLLRVYKQLQGLGGSFGVSNPSAAVRSVLELAGLEALLGASAERPRAADTVEPRIASIEGSAFDVFDLAPGASMRCACIGNPERLIGGRFAEGECHRLSVSETTLVVGVGAFGTGYDDCRGRFGELLAVAGGAAHQPTDGSNAPDYLLGAGAFVPELQVLYALACEGRFARLLRFDRSGAGALSLSALTRACLQAAEADAVAIAGVVESAGLLGAALRRSPAGADLSFDVASLREWLSFTPERVHARGLALVTGIAARSVAPTLAPFLRPLGAAGPSAHLHAAAFSYSPLRKGRLDLKSTVSALFEQHQLEGVLHLLSDDRDIVGSGESQFARGACWVSPIEIAAGRGDAE